MMARSSRMTNEAVSSQQLFRAIGVEAVSAST